MASEERVSRFPSSCHRLQRLHGRKDRVHKAGRAKGQAISKGNCTARFH